MAPVLGSLLERRSPVVGHECAGAELADRAQLFPAMPVPVPGNGPAAATTLWWR